MAVDVFISFSSADRDLAERIYDRLLKFGMSPWMSSRDIQPGMDYQGSIVDAIQQAKVVLLVFSSQANHSAEVVKELSLASTKLVIPARIEDVLPEGAFRYQISNRQFYDLFEDFDRRLDGLCSHVQAAVSGDAAAGQPASGRKAPGRVRRAKPERSMLPWIVAGVFAVVAAGAIAWIKLAPRFAATAQPAPVATTDAAGTASAAAADSDTPPLGTESPGTDEAPAPPPSSGPSAAAQTFAAMLAPEGYRRYTSISKLKAQLPLDMSPEDAALILANTGGDRLDAIKVLVDRLAGGLDGPGAGKVIGDLTGYPRYSAIRVLAEATRLKRGLTARDASTLLANTGGDRRDSIAAIAPYLADDLDAASAVAILEGLYGYPRYTAIKDLVSATRLKRGLTAQEAAAIIAGTQGNQEDAISALVSCLANDMDAASAATLLEGLSGYPRYTAIRTLVNAGKIKRGISQSDIPRIVGDVGSNQADALEALAPLMN